MADLRIIPGGGNSFKWFHFLECRYQDVRSLVIYWLTTCWLRDTSWYFVLASRSLCVYNLDNLEVNTK